jgi:hypothetical protein
MKLSALRIHLLKVFLPFCYKRCGHIFFPPYASRDTNIPCFVVTRFKINNLGQIFPNVSAVEIPFFSLWTSSCGLCDCDELSQETVNYLQQNNNKSNNFKYFCTFFWHCGPTRDMVSSFMSFLEHTTTHLCRQDSSRRAIRLSQRPLPDNTQHSQQTDSHVPGGIHTHNLSRWAATFLLNRLRGHSDRRLYALYTIKDNCTFVFFLIKC